AITPNQVTSFVDANFDVPHQHEHFELMYVLSGSLTNYIENKVVRYYAGDGCLMNPNVLHYEVPSSDCLVVFVNFSKQLYKAIFDDQKTELNGKVFQFLNNNLNDLGISKRSFIEFSDLKFKKNNIFIDLIDNLQLELLSTQPGRAFFHCGLLLRILDTLQNPNQFGTKIMNLDLNKEEFLVTRIMNYISNHEGVVKRKDIADNFHYNEDYLAKLVKKITGTSISNLAHEVRLQSIKEKLLNTSLSINKISQLSGFASESHFFQYFKKATNSTPSEYRLKYRKQD
ncbi:MAG: AraC family transcriptional regulator, partial [Enterococcus sp.]|nr:AraC family transcriptional regulator [Enterococcus sp.]